MSTPAVSVVTPFTNQAAYLDQAIVSVRAQTFADWELVLVDDGSSDGSRAIAERAAGADPRRIRVVDAAPHGGGGAASSSRDAASPNRGAAAARNHGLRVARGALAAFLDADDLFLPAKLADAVAVFAQHPEVAIVHAPTRWWYDGVPGRDWVERPGVATERVHPPPKLLIDVMLRQRGDIPCTCGVVLRRDAALAVGGFEDRFALYEDQSLWAKLFLAHPAYVIDACHARYRQHATSTSALAAARGDYDRYRAHAAQEAFFAWLAEYVAAHGADAAVLRAIARARAIGRRPLVGRLHLLAAQTLRRFVASRLS